METNFLIMCILLDSKLHFESASHKYSLLAEGITNNTHTNRRARNLERNMQCVCWREKHTAWVPYRGASSIRLNYITLAKSNLGVQEVSILSWNITMVRSLLSPQTWTNHSKIFWCGECLIGYSKNWCPRATFIFQNTIWWYLLRNLNSPVNESP